MILRAVLKDHFKKFSPFCLRKTEIAKLKLKDLKKLWHKYYYCTLKCTSHSNNNFKDYHITKTFWHVFVYTDMQHPIWKKKQEVLLLIWPNGYTCCHFITFFHFVILDWLNCEINIIISSLVCTKRMQGEPQQEVQEI